MWPLSMGLGEFAADVSNTAVQRLSSGLLQGLSTATCVLVYPRSEISSLVSKHVFLLQVIKVRVKDLMIPRYKIVVVTHIGQLNEQSMQIGSRCLWDPASDTFASYVFKNTSLFALAVVYAVYFE